MSLPYNSQTVQAYQNQINAFNDKIVNGTITETERQQAKADVGNYYEYLAATGIKYGEAAYDVSQNQNAFGQFANKHLELSAIDQGKDPSAIGILKSDFMIKLALGDADARLQTSDGNISYHDIAELHYDILQSDFGLNKTAWGGTFFEEFSGSGSWMDYGGYDHNVDVLQINAFDSLVNDRTSNGVSGSEAFQSLLKTKESGNDNLFWDALGNGLASSRVLNAIYNLSDGLKDFNDNNGHIIANLSDKIKNAFSNFESIFDSSGNVKPSQQDFYNKFTGDQLDASKILVTDNGNIFLLGACRKSHINSPFKFL